MERIGQYAIVEQTILLGAGIVIALGFLGAFQVASDDMQQSVAERQTALLANYMASTTVELVESGAEGRYTVELPDGVATQSYAIQMDDNGIRAVTAGSSYRTTVHGLPSRINLEGHLVSRDNVVALEFEDNTVRLVEQQ